jgi:RHS repeat-associated protein
VVQGGAYKSILRDAVQAGGVYSFTVELWKIPNTTISTDPSFGFQYGASSFEGVSIPYTEANNSTSNNPVKRTVQIKLPGTTSYSATFGTNPQTTAYPRLMIYCQNCLVGKFDVTMLTARYRVVSRTIVDDVTDTSQTFSYEYDEAATNDPAHSAAVAAEDPDDDNDLYADPYTDYRGSAMSREIGPVGTDGTRRITTTWYAQDDDKKGQSVASMVGTRDFYQQFESTSWSTYDPDWDYNGAAPVFERVDGDIAAKVNNSAADWTKGLYRPTTSLADGEGVTVQFRLGSTGMQSVLAVASGTYGTGSYIRWGLRYASGNIYFHTCTTSESTCNDGSSPPVVLSGVSANTWYVAQIIIDHDQEFLARVWERNNLVHVGRYQQDLNLATTNWKFIQKSKSGTTWLDEYSEGKVYSFSTTGYSSTIQHGEDLDANLEDYLDLAINWTRPVTSTNMNFNGDGAWIGTRTISKYEAADQGGTQYGNQTHVIESKWSGSAWQDYRATRTWYYPYTPTGKYLVGLPGVTKRYKCGGADCDYSSEDLLNMQWYLYDGQTKYWVPPASPTGKLTTQRTFVCFANDSNVCYDGYDSDYKRQMYSDTQFEYDDWGNTVKTKVYSGYGYYAIVTGDSVLASTGLRETTACYGNSGKPTGCTDDGYYTYKLWEKSPLTASTTQTTNWSYSGALWNGSSYTGYTLGVPVSEQGPNGVNTKITAEYDYFGRLSKIIKPGDSSTYPTLQAVYYDSWQPMLVDVYQRITAGTGTIYSQRKFYNGLGQVIQVQTPRAEVSDNSCSSDGDTAPDICDLLVDSGYDGYGQVITQTVPYAVEDWYSGMPGYPTPYRGRNFDDSPRNYTSTVYDALGRSTTATAPDGTSSVTSYPATPNGFTGYSETRVKDARNNTTRSISDVWGHTYQVIPLNGDSDTSPINPSVTYSYNELDQLLTAVRGGATVTLSYDYAGRKIKQIDPDLGTWVYNFDATGNLTSQKDARCSGSNCVTISYTYDLASRLTQKSYTIPSGLNVAPTTTMSYGYDNGTYGIGQRTSMTDGSGSTAWTYDSRGRVTQESKVITGSGTYVTQYTYNSANQVVTMRYPADNAGGLGETLTMAYNAQNTIKNVLSNTNSYYYLEQAFYDAAGRIDQLYLGAVNTVNNPVLVTNYDYYAWTSQGGRLQYLKSGVWGSLTSLQNLSYTYDAVGNVETILDGNNSNQKQCFSYDNLYRLTKATTYQDTPKGCSTQLGNGNYTEDYEYSDDDPNPTGNLSSKSGVGDYTYDPTLKHAVTATGNGWSFGYDANGNMITRNVGNAYSLSYDAENRLDKVKKDGVAIARFIYDADANRVQSVITGTTTATTVYIGNYYEETFDNNTFSPIEINDPGFETGTGWSQVVNASYPNTSYYRSTWGTSTPHSGSYGYALSNQAYGWLQSDAISVLPNTQYDLYAWVKGEIDGEDSNGAWLIRAIYYNSGGGIISTPDIASGGPGTISNTYAQKGNRVTTPANTVSVVIQLQFYHNSGWVTYDDVSLIQVGNSTNLVANPGFETTSNWTENRAGGYSGTSLWRNTWGTAVPHGGSYAYVISNHAYAYLQSDAISVLPNTEYDLYAWVKGEIDGDDSNGAWIIRAVYYNSSGGAISYQNAANGGPGTITNTYAQKGGRVTTPANTATMRIQLQDYHNSGWVTYDDVTLIQVGYSTNLAPNPGFETSSNWTANAVGGYPGTSLYRSTWGTAAPHGGSYAYALSNHAYGYLESNSIVVRAGTDYDVYAWVRGEIDADDSYGDWIIRVQFYNASGTPISYVDADRGAVSALTTTYQQQGGRVTAPASAASMKIQFWNYMNSGWVTFDDVSVAAEVTRTSYYYAGATRIAMRTGSGSGTTGLKWMGADQLNSTSLVTTDVNATNATKQTYKAWGENRYPTTSTLPTTMRYTGQRHESSLGIYYYGARWYDPSLGRFLSPDSIIPQSQGVQAWDRYAGMNNNPVRYNDPSGHWINVVLGAAIGAAVGATLYSINTARSGQDWNLGQALTVGATGAAAGALISTGIGAGAGLAMFTGIGLASGGGGYLAANILTANQFDTSDFAIASGVGAASGYLGPSVATTLPGAMALGGVSNVAQYGLTQAANGEDITATGVAWAVGTGMFGGAVGGKYSKVDFDSLTRPTVRIGGNTYRPGSIGYDPEAFGYLAKDALLRKLPGGFTKAFLGGVFLNLPQEPESCPSEGAC